MIESARSTGNFNRKITVADSNNIIAILDMNAANSKYQIFEEDYLVEFQAVLEDLKITVGLLSLAEAPWPDTNALMSESATMAEIAKIRTQGQKISLGLYTAIGNGPWQYESEVVLQNQGGSETHVPILVPFLSSNETLLIAGNFKLGVKIEPKWNQPLKASDYLIVKGTYRQIVSFSKKKDDDVEALSARIAALELALEGKLVNLPGGTLLGRNGTTGTVQQILQSQFAPTANPLFTGIVGSAGQISFPAAQSPSNNDNILDDYEEGIWIPTFTYSTPGTSSISFFRNSGRYQKIGNRATVTFDIRINSFSKGTASGYLIVTGLPFLPRPGGGYDNNIGSLYVGSTPFTGIPMILTSTGLSTGNTLFLFKQVTGAAPASLEDPIGGALYFGQITYETNG